MLRASLTLGGPRQRGQEQHLPIHEINVSHNKIFLRSGIEMCDLNLYVNVYVFKCLETVPCTWRADPT